MTRATIKDILNAATMLVLTRGVNGLTIDAVARTAKLSKGGVLYHFPSKESLIEGMVAMLVKGLEEDLNRELAKDSNAPGAFTRAFLRASLNPIDPRKDKAASNKLGLFAALSAGTALDPVLLKPLQDGFVEWQRKLEDDGIDPAVASVVRMAVDGLWFAEVLQLGAPRTQLREQMLTVLLRMTNLSKP